MVPLDDHFKNKKLAKDVFDVLFENIKEKIGKAEIISLPCCIHLFGTYDFLAALPKKDRLEIRFGLNRALNDRRVKQSVPVSRTAYKNCIDLQSGMEIDDELIDWLKESYGARAGEPY